MKRFALVPVVLLLMLAACEDEQPAPVDPTNPAVTKIPEQSCDGPADETGCAQP